MNALAQVRHLFVNDVRRLRWMLVAYVACVAIATVAATSLPMGKMGWFQAPPLLVVLIGFVLVASAVQADSPCRPDAFWMSRPIQPFAVLGAKLVLALLVVAVPVAAADWSLIHLGFASSEIWSALGHAATSFSDTLLLGMAIAAVTRDLRSFANTAVAVIVLGLVALVALYGRLGFIPGQPTAGGTIHTAVFYLAPLVLLLFVYWRRDSVKMARIAGATALAGLFLFEPFTLAPDRPATQHDVADASADAPHLSVAFVRVASNATAARLTFLVTGTAWRNAARLVITPDSVLVHVRDGSTVALRNQMPTIVVKLPSTAPESLPWRDVAPDWPTSMALSRGEVQALASGVSGIEIVGRAEGYALNVAAVLPFVSGPKTSRQGARLQLDSVQNDPYGASAAITMFAIQHKGVDASALLRRVRMARVEWALPRFQLVDDSTHQAIRLATPSSGSTDVSMVLPGANLTCQWAHVQTPLDYTATDAAGQVRRVHFLYLEWEYVGSGQVRARSPIE